YGILLHYPGQHMLRLKQSHNPHNLLSKAKKDCVATEKPRAHVYMPPELLVPVEVPIGVLKSFYLLPSLMHRLVGVPDAGHST
ncbi:Dicer-like, partial [Thalictrum thalictroides]